MDKIIGFIGCGNMGRAMMGGIIKSNIVSNQNIIISDLYQPSLDVAEKELGVRTTKSNLEVVAEADILILSVKPNIFPIVADEIKSKVKRDCIIVSIMAGVTIAEIEHCFEKGIKLVRTMPNTPALVSEAMSALCPNRNVSDEELEEVKNIYESFGRVEILKESFIDAVVAISGSSPAYVCMVIEAMADAGVALGLTRASSYKMASQAVLGTAKMILETGKHPAELKDMVCSPGGTTIDAVVELEKCGMRNAIIQGMLACAKKSKEMSKVGLKIE
ncbi:MAG: pyrroline-5-carboxylate reductase [Clostridium sp.]